MLLVVDIGNTNIVVARFDKDVICDTSRIKTKSPKVLSEFSELMASLEYDEAVVSSVVPILTGKICNLINKKPFLISRNIKSGLLQSSIPCELGSDLLCNLIAAHFFYPDEYVTVADFGTAFTTCTVSPQGKVCGVTISPGIWTSIKSLFSNTAQIPPIELSMPETVLGLDTISSVRAGVVYGFKGQLEALVSLIEKELGTRVKLIATGGFSAYISSLIDRIDIVDVHWTLKGAKIAFEFQDMK